MPFAYSSKPLSRKHGPSGYARHEEYRPWLRDEFAFRCAYCLNRERWLPGGVADFEIDHFVPQSAPTGPALALVYENLYYACRTCNKVKQGHKLPLDPSKHALADHVEVLADGTIQPVNGSRLGRAFIRALRLDRKPRSDFRERKLRGVDQAIAAGDMPAIVDLLGYPGGPPPDDLPDLSSLRPTGGNSLPDGVQASAHALHVAGRLPSTYC